MATIKSFSTLYLQGQGLASNGGKLPEKEKTLTVDELRKEMANDIAKRLCEAYAMIEVAKELDLFSEDYAEKVIGVSKDNDTTKDYRKPYYKKSIYNKINSALKKANKPLIGDAKNDIIADDFD